jgi:serine/threonine protein kinase
MAQATGRNGRVVGDYLVGRQIGSGSFSVVWHARHRVHGTEVAIKEIVTNRLNKKLQESLMSEIFILKRINHPNIIRLHDIIEVGLSFCFLFFLFCFKTYLVIFYFWKISMLLLNYLNYSLV